MRASIRARVSNRFGVMVRVRISLPPSLPGLGLGHRSWS